MLNFIGAWNILNSNSVKVVQFKTSETLVICEQHNCR